MMSGYEAGIAQIPASVFPELMHYNPFVSKVREINLILSTFNLYGIFIVNNTNFF